jgi:signal transduction histidine kinase
MTLLPRSLFWRLMLVMVIGLILAQIIGSMILLKDRQDLVQYNLGKHLVDRVTSVVRLINESAPEDRERIIQAFDSPEFRVFLSDTPRPLDENAVSPAWLTSRLRSSLPTSEKVIVSIIPMIEDRDHLRSERYQRKMERNLRDGRSRKMWRLKHAGFLAQVELQSGEWLIFHRPVPPDIQSRHKKLLAYLAILVISIVLISFIAVRYVTRPLGVLANAADDLGRDIQSPPLEEKGSAEVRRAARAFNTMQSRLRRYIEDRGEILAAVSHDLKTPITRMRLRTEMLENDKVQQKFGQDLDDMEQMVNATLDFMRGTESSEKPVPVDIMALLEALRDDMSDLGAKVELEIANIRPYLGRPLLLKRCLTNLIENAVRYGEEARISVEQSKEQLQIIVADSGPGIPEAERERIFKPFVRGEASRSKDTGGNGLGLSIARNIARAHGGELTLRNGKDGVGLEAVVSLPLA